MTSIVSDSGKKDTMCLTQLIQELEHFPDFNPRLGDSMEATLAGNSKGLRSRVFGGISMNGFDGGQTSGAFFDRQIKVSTASFDEAWTGEWEFDGGSTGAWSTGFRWR